MKYSPLYFVVILILGSVSYVFYMHRNDTPIYERVDSVLCKKDSDSIILNDSTPQIDNNYNKINVRHTANASRNHQEPLLGVSALYVNHKKHSEQNQDNLALKTKKTQKKQKQTRTKKTKTKKEKKYSGQCQATTQKGWQCSRRAEPGRRYCWQHK